MVAPIASFCSQCGIGVDKDSQFCSNCGTALGKNSEQTRRNEQETPMVPAARTGIAEERTSVRKPTFASYLVAFVFPPFYFFSRKRIPAGIFSLILFVVSLPLFFVFGLGIFFWFGNAIWAMWSLRYELVDYQVREQARAIAEELSYKR